MEIIRVRPGAGAGRSTEEDRELAPVSVGGPLQALRLSGVAPAGGDRALAEALQNWCLSRLAYFKVPGWVLFVESLPTTGTQKVQKTQIFPRGEDPRWRGGAIDLRERKKRR